MDGIEIITENNNLTEINEITEKKDFFDILITINEIDRNNNEVQKLIIKKEFSIKIDCNLKTK